MMFHTMAPEVAIEDLKEIYFQKKKDRIYRVENEG